MDDRQPGFDDVTELRARLLRRARRYAPDRATAEDMVQEALLRVWARLRQDPPIEAPERYVQVALRNIARTRALPAGDLDETALPGAPAVDGDRLAARRVLDALKALPEAQGSLIRDHAVLGLSYTDLARRHGLPVGTVMSRVARGRTRLCRSLGIPRETPVEALLDRIA